MAPRLDELPALFRRQATSCAPSPSYVRLFERLAVLAEREDAGRTFAPLEAAWRGRELGAWYGATLLVSASLHRAVLESDPAVAMLAPFFRDVSAGDDAALDRALAAALGSPSERIVRFWQSGTVQTNEVSRAVAWLTTASTLRGATGRDVVLVELGCSAGLVLVGDEVGLTWDEEGERERGPPPAVRARLGIDAAPLDARDDEHRLVLRASLWPGQDERRARLERALAALDHRRREVELVEGTLPGATDAISPFARAASERVGAPLDLLVYNTITTAYLDEAAYAELSRRLDELARSRPSGGTVLWVELETPRGRPDLSHRARLTARVSGEVIHLADTEPHPRRLILEPGAFSRLRERLRAP